MRDKYEIVGEDYVADPRERRLRVLAQLMDKPLTVLLVAVAFAAAARGPSLLIPGYRPSGWFVFGLWVSFIIAVRLVLVALLGWFRSAFSIPAAKAE